MKKLFVVNTINNFKKRENQEIFQTNEKIESEKNYPSLKFSENQLNNNNSIASTTTNSSVESRKYSLNLFSPESSSSFNITPSYGLNSKNNEYIKFIGKKKKFLFDIIKNESENLENIISQKTEKNGIIKSEDLKKIK